MAYPTGFPNCAAPAAFKVIEKHSLLSPTSQLLPAVIDVSSRWEIQPTESSPSYPPTIKETIKLRTRKPRIKEPHPAAVSLRSSLKGFRAGLPCCSAAVA